MLSHSDCSPGSWPEEGKYAVQIDSKYFIEVRRVVTRCKRSAVLLQYKVTFMTPLATMLAIMMPNGTGCSGPDRRTNCNVPYSDPLLEIVAFGAAAVFLVRLWTRTNEHKIGHSNMTFKSFSAITTCR